MGSRRQFLSQVASGLAGTLAAPASVLSSPSRVRVGLIGAGERGIQLLREAVACGAEAVAVADVWLHRLAVAHHAFPGASLHQDPAAIIEDPAVEAVILASPTHLHASQCLCAWKAGKHVYVERTVAFTIEEARRLREAASTLPRRVIQVGHQWCSSGLMQDALRFLQPEMVGRITAIRAWTFRNTPQGKAPYRRPVPPDLNPRTVRWDAFLGPAPTRDFDPERFANWRLYWEYSGGPVFEHLSQQLAFWYQALDLQIPRSAMAMGGLFLWKQGREVPDTMAVTFEHGEELLFTWTASFGNSQPGTGEEVLGTHGTIVRTQQIRYVPQRVNRPEACEILGRTRTEPNAHMVDFLAAVREGRPPRCSLELGLRVSVACRMAVESFFRQRAVHWDPARWDIL